MPDVGREGSEPAERRDPNVPQPHRTDRTLLTVKAYTRWPGAMARSRRRLWVAVFQTLPARAPPADRRATGLSKPAAEGMSGRPPVNGSRGMCRC